MLDVIIGDARYTVTNAVGELLIAHEIMNLALDRNDPFDFPARDRNGTMVTLALAPTREEPLVRETGSGEPEQVTDPDSVPAELQLSDTLHDLYEVQARRDDPLLRAIYRSAAASYRRAMDVIDGRVDLDSIPPSRGA